MPDGHCRHCVKYPTNHAGQCRDDEGACWVLRCPACAEAERIEAALLDEYDEHEDIAVLAALRIVRGEA